MFTVTLATFYVLRLTSWKYSAFLLTNPRIKLSLSLSNVPPNLQPLRSPRSGFYPPICPSVPVPILTVWSAGHQTSPFTTGTVCHERDRETSREIVWCQHNEHHSFRRNLPTLWCTWTSKSTRPDNTGGRLCSQRRSPTNASFFDSFNHIYELTHDFFFFWIAKV